MPNTATTAPSGLPANLAPALQQRLSRIKLMIFDVDGVLTDGGLYYGPDGEAIKRFNVLDGLGIKMLQQFGIATAIISARKSAIVTRRAQDLGIGHVFQGSHDKQAAFTQLLQQTGCQIEQCGYIGDDVIDLPLLTQVGLACAVANCHPDLKQQVHYLTGAAGGHGAAREVCDMILRAQGHYAAALAQVTGLT
jgi:3-deoxy-D-manno-octulosonate 8-phosphate phosphatase (KDO 8-P phosphatase)